jgi:hypothetical protein
MDAERRASSPVAREATLEIEGDVIRCAGAWTVDAYRYGVIDLASGVRKEYSFTPAEWAGGPFDPPTILMYLPRSRRPALKGELAGRYVNPQNTTDDIAGVVTTTKETVIERFSQVTEYADDAMHTAMEFLNELREAVDEEDFDVPEIGIFFPAPISTGFNIGDPPVSPEVEIFLPEFPEAPILAAIGFVTGIQARLQYDLANGGTRDERGRGRADLEKGRGKRSSPGMRREDRL